jgi:hypothetical protein
VSRTHVLGVKGTQVPVPAAGGCAEGGGGAQPHQKERTGGGDQKREEREGAKTRSKRGEPTRRSTERPGGQHIPHRPREWCRRLAAGRPVRRGSVGRSDQTGTSSRAKGQMSIGVYARLRPLDGRAEGAETGVSIQGPTQVLLRNLEFTLDHAFDTNATQAVVYEVVGRERVAKVSSGINVCLLAYGQTGSGKTHTMFGNDEVLRNWRAAASEHYGLALRSISDLFEAAAGLEADVECSYIEVYNDTVNCLVGLKKALPLREGPSQSLYVEGLAVAPVRSLDEALEAWQCQPDRSRHVDEPALLPRPCCLLPLPPSPLGPRCPHSGRSWQAGTGRSRWHGIVQEVILCRGRLDGTDAA